MNDDDSYRESKTRSLVVVPSQQSSLVIEQNLVFSSIWSICIEIVHFLQSSLLHSLLHCLQHRDLDTQYIIHQTKLCHVMKTFAKLTPFEIHKPFLQKPIFEVSELDGIIYVYVRGLVLNTILADSGHITVIQTNRFSRISTSKWTQQCYVLKSNRKYEHISLTYRGIMNYTTRTRPIPCKFTLLRDA